MERRDNPLVMLTRRLSGGVRPTHILGSAKTFRRHHQPALLPLTGCIVVRDVKAAMLADPRKFDGPNFVASLTNWRIHPDPDIADRLRFSKPQQTIPHDKRPSHIAGDSRT
jgi:hypothetical protein